jgi:hypothetical protein
MSNSKKEAARYTHVDHLLNRAGIWKKIKKILSPDVTINIFIKKNQKYNLLKDLFTQAGFMLLFMQAWKKCLIFYFSVTVLCHRD